MLCVLPFAVTTAWLLAKKSWPGKAIVETIVNLPLALPPIATGLILLKLFGNNGLIGSLLYKLGIELIFTWKAIVIACAVIAFPLFVRTARTGFHHVSDELEDSARTLGANEWHVFFRITLPLAGHSILFGAAMAFLRSLGEFGATVLVAGYIPGKTDILSLSIFNAVQLGNDDKAYALLLISTAIAFVFLMGCEIIFKNKPIGI